MRGDFNNASTQNASFDLSPGTVQFHGTGVQDMEVAGADLGLDPNGWIDNFALGTLRLELDVRVSLTDVFDNRLDGNDNEALYVDVLDMANGAWIDLNGRNLYYRNGGGLKQLFYGDFDLSGDVGRSDFLVLQATLGTGAGAGWINGDTDGDGDVDAQDYLKWKENIGLSSGPMVIPEPATLVLMASGAGLALLRRRRKK